MEDPVSVTVNYAFDSQFSSFLIFQLFAGIWTAGVGSFTLTNDGICSNKAECINLRLHKVSFLYGSKKTHLNDVNYILFYVPDTAEDTWSSGLHCG